jgi:alpha-N-arabinofuranosidase
MQRRDFVKSALAAGAGALVVRAAVSQAADARIDLLLDEPLGTVSPNVFGHFTEDLGGVIYGGVWVGEGSAVPNTGGIRTALVNAMRRIHAPVVRWPGGCFADSYDWRDGIGPRAQRPRRTNFWIGEARARGLTTGPQLYDPNEFGTDEFMRFCRLCGAEPYVAANVRSLSPLDFDLWVEYCNSPAASTTLADERAKNGSSAPYNVRYWGVGNESWGCGGSFLPADYATEFRRFTTWVPEYGPPLSFIASGPDGNDLDWTRRVFENLFGRRGDVPGSWSGWSVHHYAWDLGRGRINGWDAAKGDALNFDPVDYYELLRQADLMESIIRAQWATMGEFDAQHKIKLVVDEYGPWYRPGTAIEPADLLGQQITMRDAIATALTLDTFIRHPEKVGMAACAQLINCLNSLFLSREDQFIVTPNYHVFDLYRDHQGAQAVRSEFTAPDINYDRDGKPAQFWGLKGSASRRERQLALTVVNPDLANPRDTEIVLRGGRAASGSARVLWAADVHAHNTFSAPNSVTPRNAPVAVGADGSVRFTFQPASVTRLSLALQ